VGIDSLEPLRDGHGRPLTSLRVSVTDRCNFRCRYCMPAEGMDWLPREEILEFEEIERLTALLARMGITDLRLTGGEPLARRDFPRLLARLSQIPGLDDVSLTTNGYLLEAQLSDLVAAGLRRVNVSLDSLARHDFFELTRRDALGRVLSALRAAEAFPELHPIKVNCVAIRGFTESQIASFVELARHRPYEVRFIEFMPLDADRSWDRESVLSGAEVRAQIEAEHPLEPLPREPHATARTYRFQDGAGTIGFVNPVSEPFCSDCNRLRLTADGKLRTCLFSLEETDLRARMRAGGSDAELERLIREAAWGKELKHRISEPGFRQPARTMSAIGG
jgi:cyclic pyranopterin phosphate synthase